MRKPTDGSRTDEVVYKHGAPLLGFTVSPDGSKILLVANNWLLLLPRIGVPKAEMFEEGKGGRF